MKHLRSFTLALCMAALVAPAMPVTAHATLKRIQPLPQPKPICCKTRNGFALLLPDRCRQMRGSPVSEQFCHRPASKLVCCKTNRGFSKLSADRCIRARGAAVEPRWCKLRALQADKVCCQVRYGGGIKVKFVWIPRNQCAPPARQIVGDKYCH